MNHHIGNILDGVKQGIILQQVNAQGVMGSGIAKAIRDKWPEVYTSYSNLITEPYSHHGAAHLGKIVTVQVQPGLFVVNMVAQQFYGRDGTRYTSYDALDTCLAKVARMNGMDPLPIHHPLIGCGLGGGNWSIVKTIIEANLGFETTLWTLE